MKKFLILGIITFMLSFSFCVDQNSKGDEVQFLRNYPMKENWVRNEKQASEPNNIARFVFSNDELLCKYNFMYGGEAKGAELIFEIYKRGSEEDSLIYRAMGPWKRIYTKNYAICIYSPCTEELSNFPFIEELISKLESM